MFKDIKGIIKLLDELVRLHYPITLDIQWSFQETLAYITFSEKWESREVWEKDVRSHKDDGIWKLIRRIWKDKRFRKNIISVLSYEKENILRVDSSKTIFIISEIGKERGKVLISVFGESFCYDVLKEKANREKAYIDKIKERQDKIFQEYNRELIHHRLYGNNK